MDGILLGGGSGKRLSPLTTSINKHLLPIFDKPMIFYPLSILMLAGIKEVLIITTKSDQDLFKKLLGNGENYGIQISYKVQDSPNGIADAFILGQDFIGESPVTLILGDNIFFSHDFSSIINDALNQRKGAHVFLTNVSNPEDFGDAIKSGTHRGGFSNSVRGGAIGGYYPAADFKTIEFVNIATTGNGRDFGDVAEAGQMGGTVSNATRGVFFGGYMVSSPNNNNSIQFVTIATTGDSNSFGDLASKGGGGVVGCCDSHGGVI